MKKKVLIALAVVVGVLLCLALLIGVLSRCSASLSGEASGTGGSGESLAIEFSTEYITDPEELLLDERYLGYDREIRFLDQQTGFSIVLSEGTLSDYGAATALLYRMINTIMAGDSETYNTYFSSVYFDQNEPKEAFSMQKLYDIRITKMEEYKPEGKSYTEYIYALEYKIRRNNGSFRADMDSDGARIQYVVLTDRDNAILIDKMLAP